MKKNKIQWKIIFQDRKGKYNVLKVSFLSIQIQRNKIQQMPSSYAKYAFSTHMISFTHGSVIDVKRISFFQNCRKPMLVIHVTCFSLNYKHNYSPIQFYSPLNTNLNTPMNAAVEKKHRKLETIFSNLTWGYYIQSRLQEMPPQSDYQLCCQESFQDLIQDLHHID